MDKIRKRLLLEAVVGAFLAVVGIIAANDVPLVGAPLQLLAAVVFLHVAHQMVRHRIGTSWTQ